ncbi:hypothetical protein [Paenibacillus sp. WLX2291]|uniref:hypothetical protein n=1 Tax=Paenibacillus sp. WLX2291 TaxID=3296934 RepID=UPI0039841AAA
MGTTMFKDHALFEKGTGLCQSQFGRKPHSIEMSLHSAGISLMFKDLIDFTDARLPENKDKRYMHVFILLQQFISPILSKRIVNIFHKEIAHVFIDWQEYNNTACMTFLFQDWQAAVSYEQYEAQESLHDEISRVTKDVEKSPVTVQSLWLSPKRLLVIRTGLLIYLERKLVRKGFSNSLRIAKRELELERFKQEIDYSQLVNQSLHSAYLDWKFEHDISVLLLQFD